MNRMLIGALGLLACAGCNTMSGLGQDISAAGRALTQNAHDTSSVEAPRQSMPGCTPDHSRSPPVTCQKTTEPNQTQQVRTASHANRNDHDNPAADDRQARAPQG